MKGRLIAAVLTLSFSVSADISPPPPTLVTLELTVEGQDQFPDLRFLVTNCKEPLRQSVLEKGKTIVCPPSRGPIRIFGFREADLNEMFAMVERDAGAAEAQAFLTAKAKTCGQIDKPQPMVPGGGARRIASRHALETHGKGGCKLRLVSNTPAAEPEESDELDPAPSASAKPTAPSPPSPAPPPQSSCGCRAAPSDGSLWAILAVVAGCGFLARGRKAGRRPHELRACHH